MYAGGEGLQGRCTLFPKPKNYRIIDISFQQNRHFTTFLFVCFWGEGGAGYTKRVCFVHL